MRINEIEEVETDVLVVGGGGAGLRAAVEAASNKVSVMMVSKARIGYVCNTGISGGGIAACMGEANSKDTPTEHLKDTMASGRFVNNKTLARVLVEEIPHQVKELQSCGAPFVEKNGQLELLQRPGHSYARGVAAFNGSGKDFTLPLRQNAARMGVKFFEDICLSHLLVEDNRMTGAIGLDRTGKIVVFKPKAIILATGGAGHIYRNTTNAGGIVGDGYALGYNAGLQLRDMEFVQFYPTASGQLGRKVVFYEVLVSVLGATIRNSIGEDIAEKYNIKDPAVMTRDRLAQVIFREISEGRATGGGAVMDLSTITPEKLKAAKGLPSWTRLDKPQIIVAPTAHFFMGGLVIDPSGWTGVEGIWAAGEVCGGVHGANRLTGNALSEIFVFGAITGREAAKWSSNNSPKDPSKISVGRAIEELKELASYNGGNSITEITQKLRHDMWMKASVVRDEKSLKSALDSIRDSRRAMGITSVKEARELTQLLELSSMLLVSEMVCRSALMRTETRGSHFRTDYPEENEDWKKNIYVSKKGDMSVETRPVQN